jgi:preprotein translocase subunit SecY
MIDALTNIFKVPDLRKRVLYTLGILAVYRIGGHIFVPGVNSKALYEWFRSQGGSTFGMLDLFTGGNLSNGTIFGLGIMPYISASIILQLLTVIWPYLEKLSKEGEVGRKKITQYTRYGTVVLAMIQALGIGIFLQKGVSQQVGFDIAPQGWGFLSMTVLTLTTGTAFIMWLGEQISERGIGNGISLIIYAGIVTGLPSAIRLTWDQFQSGQLGAVSLVLLLVLMVGVVACVVLVERAQRKIPIQYARRVVGRRIYGGASTFLPLRVNTGGVIPVIFASSILSLPLFVIPFIRLDQIRFGQILQQQIDYSMPLHNLLYFILIIFFCFFYTSIIFNPVDTADNMKKYGGFIPGIRPGKRTAEYIDRILTRLTFGGSIYLGLIALLPVILISGIRLHLLYPPAVGDFFDRILFATFLKEGMGVQFFFGGTSLLIVVGVAMDTVQQIESQLIMRHYDGFLKGTRIRGRRG